MSQQSENETVSTTMTEESVRSTGDLMREFIEHAKEAREKEEINYRKKLFEYLRGRIIEWLNGKLGSSLTLTIHLDETLDTELDRYEQSRVITEVADEIEMDLNISANGMATIQRKVYFGYSPDYKDKITFEIDAPMKQVTSKGLGRIFGVDAA